MKILIYKDEDDGKIIPKYVADNRPYGYYIEEYSYSTVAVRTDLIIEIYNEKYSRSSWPSAVYDYDGYVFIAQSSNMRTDLEADLLNSEANYDDCRIIPRTDFWRYIHSLGMNTRDIPKYLREHGKNLYAEIYRSECKSDEI